ncbi:hypothetical protein GWI33_021640 [Rhynchophorus ferrugineus]|uniref:Odorant receptor n=1 Tax=Rhynchophorus ferrugineus TaxID=354439 RepID=A0A834MIB5_RHYFE|nr:hypothetical protein GWI33_021640 [Rhynchophorus ferrugineus]
MSLVSIPKICMLIIGIWPSELIENPVRKRLYMIHKYILIIFVFSITLSLTIEWLIIYLKNKVPQMFLSLLEFEADLKSSDDAEVKMFYRKILKNNRFVDNLNKSVRYVVFIDFLLNSANVASVLFYLVTVKSVYLFYAILLLSLQLLQVFALAWVSNEVKLESVKVADAVYESPWYEQDQKIKKMLHIILMRSQKPLAITIGPFKPMTAETAIMTLQASYSYATLMMNSYKDE